MPYPSRFRPAWWLPGPHLQTLWGSLLRRRPRLATRRQRLELPDGDFLDLDWAVTTGSGPIVVVVHGLEGSIRSRYASGLLQRLSRAGLRPLLMHLRGCSGEPNRRTRLYHSGETGDLAYVVATLSSAYPGTPIAAVGYSLGGNLLLKWLGESGANTPLSAAVAVSVPFDLRNSALRLDRGLSRLYQHALLRSLRHTLQRKHRLHPLPIDWAALERARSFYAFDDLVTAPLHGFAGVEDYYRRASCRPYLAGVRVPTLVLQARDDPFLDPAAIPGDSELPPPLRLELSRHGGHVGFVAGPPWAPDYWLDGRIADFLTTTLGP